MWLKRMCAVALVALALPAVASAAPPLFSSPTPIAGDAPATGRGGPKAGGGGSPMVLRVAMGADGSATVAWEGKPDPIEIRDLYVSERAAGGGAFSPPLKVGRESQGWMALGRNDGGVRAIVWPMKVSVAAAGGTFGPPEDVPVPPRAPAIRDYSPPERDFGDVSLAVAPDGAVLVGYLENDPQAEVLRSITVLRRPDGSWTEPQVLNDYAHGPKVVADATGGLHAMWQLQPHGTEDPVTLNVADAGPDGHFGPGRVVSNPDRRSSGHLVGNRRGDLLVDWSAQANGPVIGATYRAAGGDWEQPEVLYGGIPYGERSSGAIGDHGDAAVAWTNGNAFAASRPAGGAWAPMSTTFVRQGSLNPYQLTMDANGTGLLVSSAVRSEGTSDTIVAAAIPRGGALEPVSDVSRGTDPLSVPDVASDAFGNGLVVWLRGPLNQPSTVYASGYSAAPPNVTGVAAKHDAFALKVSEPARLTVTVSGRHRRATQWSRVRPGKNTLRFSAKVRSLL